jgi:hypothetical protein
MFAEHLHVQLVTGSLFQGWLNDPSLSWPFCRSFSRWQSARQGVLNAVWDSKGVSRENNGIIFPWRTNLTAVLRSGTELAAVRNLGGVPSVLASVIKSNTAWGALGLHPSDSAAVLAALWRSQYHPNQVGDL